MKIKFRLEYLIGISLGSFLLLVNILLFLDTRWFYSILVLSLAIISSQFWFDFFKENKRQQQMEEYFLEFIRSLVETVKGGISIPAAILNISDKNYGPLTPNVRKLSSQIRLGIPIHGALITFANNTQNKVIKRSVAIIIEAEESGGNIEDVLEAVTDSVVQVKRVGEERKASTFSQIVQGYIIFFVFIGIMLLLQVKLFPTLLEFSGELAGGLGGASFASAGDLNLDAIFLALIIIQGLFAGLMIGKFSEGSIRYGIKHSLVLIISALLLITTIKGGLL